MCYLKMLKLPSNIFFFIQLHIFICNLHHNLFIWAFKYILLSCAMTLSLYSIDYQNCLVASLSYGRMECVYNLFHYFISYYSFICLLGQYYLLPLIIFNNSTLIHPSNGCVFGFTHKMNTWILLQMYLCER